jgi:hypothetical protein
MYGCRAIAQPTVPETEYTKRMASDKGLQKSIAAIKQNIISQKSQAEI